MPNGIYNNISNYPSGLSWGRQEVVRVNGRNGAEAYQMPPNSSVLLLDETAPVVWLKTTDGASYPTITGYTITPLKTQEQTQQEYIDSLEERIAKLERAINNGESYSGGSKYSKQNSANK